MLGGLSATELEETPPTRHLVRALTRCHPKSELRSSRPHRCAGGGMKGHASNMITLRTVLPAFMAAKPSLISDSFSLAEIQSSRCSLPRM